jgi:hypothetical protein
MNRRSLLCLLAVMLSLIIALGGCASPPQATPAGPAAPNPNPVLTIADVKTAQLSDTFAGRPEPLDAAIAHDRAVIAKILGWLSTAEVVSEGHEPVRDPGSYVLTLRLTNGDAATVSRARQQEQHVVFDPGDGKLIQLKAPDLAKWLSGVDTADLKMGALPPPSPSPLREYTPVTLALSDYRDVVRDLTAKPDPAIVTALQALGGRVDTGSPLARAGMHYRLMLKGPNGEEAELSSVGDGLWQGPDGYREGKALQEAAEHALPTPERQPGDLEYLLTATALKVSQEPMTHSPEGWNERRQWVVRALRDRGSPTSAAPTDPPPLKLAFTVNGNTEVVEVWDEMFRYAGKVYRAEHILQGLGSILSAG